MTVRDEDGFEPDEETDDPMTVREAISLLRDALADEGTPGQQLRKTCLHDNGDGTFALTLLVDVRAADIGEATEILGAGRRLQERFGLAVTRPPHAIRCDKCGVESTIVSAGNGYQAFCGKCA